MYGFSPSFWESILPGMPRVLTANREFSALCRLEPEYSASYVAEAELAVCVARVAVAYLIGMQCYHGNRHFLYQCSLSVAMPTLLLCLHCIVLLC